MKLIGTKFCPYEKSDLVPKKRRCKPNCISVSSEKRENHSFVFLSFTISSCLSRGIDMYWWNSIE